MAVVDELVVDDDEVVRILLAVLVGEEYVVGPKVPMAQGVDLRRRRRHEVSVQRPVGLLRKGKNRAWLKDKNI